MEEHYRTSAFMVYIAYNGTHNEFVAVWWEQNEFIAPLYYEHTTSLIWC